MMMGQLLASPPVPSGHPRASQKAKVRIGLAKGFRLYAR
jgi:hypothetical protein